jgi:hypothetical protein
MRRRWMGWASALIVASTLAGGVAQASTGAPLRWHTVAIPTPTPHDPFGWVALPTAWPTHPHVTIGADATTTDLWQDGPNRLSFAWLDGFMYNHNMLSNAFDPWAVWTGPLPPRRWHPTAYIWDFEGPHYAGFIATSRGTLGTYLCMVQGPDMPVLLRIIRSVKFYRRDLQNG